MITAAGGVLVFYITKSKFLGPIGKAVHSFSYVLPSDNSNWYQLCTHGKPPTTRAAFRPPMYFKTSFLNTFAAMLWF